MVEFALVLPLLLVILFGVMEFGQVFYSAVAVVNAAHAGAMYGAQGAAFWSDTGDMQAAALKDGKDVSGLTATASEVCYCSGVSTACAASCASKTIYVKVVTQASVHETAPWPGVPNPINLSASAQFRVQ